MRVLEGKQGIRLVRRLSFDGTREFRSMTHLAVSVWGKLLKRRRREGLINCCQDQKGRNGGDGEMLILLQENDEGDGERNINGGVFALCEN